MSAIFLKTYDLCQGGIFLQTFNPCSDDCNARWTSAEEAFEAFKSNAKGKYTGIIEIEIANETIEEK